MRWEFPRFWLIGSAKSIAGRPAKISVTEPVSHCRYAGNRVCWQWCGSWPTTPNWVKRTTVGVPGRPLISTLSRRKYLILLSA